MIKYFTTLIIMSLVLFSCRKAIEPLAFDTNPVDPASGIVLEMVEIDSVNYFEGIFGPYRIIYFHLNFDQFPKKFGTPEIIDIYIDQKFLAYRNVSFTNNAYSAWINGGSGNTEYGFIITSYEDNKTDLQIPIVP
jgi:hypothetical protein